MINFDEYANEHRISHNPNRPYIPDHPYGLLIIGGSGSWKINTLLNLIINKIDKILLIKLLIKYICLQKISMKRNINF